MNTRRYLSYHLTSLPLALFAILASTASAVLADGSPNATDNDGSRFMQPKGDPDFPGFPGRPGSPGEPVFPGPGPFPMPPGGFGSTSDFGSPLPGISPDQLALFLVGSNQFATLDDTNHGLGPIFNSPVGECPSAVGCITCHAQPAIGGLVPSFETRAGLITAAGFDPLTDLGGSLFHSCAVPGSAVETNPVIGLPNGVTAFREIIPVFGDGLIEAIPDQTIVINAFISRGDGVNGKPAYISDPGSTNASGQNPIRVGRFGWKAQEASLRGFSGDAYDNEMDVSNPVFPYNLLPNAPPVPVPYADLEDLPDATGKADIDRFTDFMRLLAPPPALPLTNQSTLHGSLLFATVGCARCHTPVLFTGFSTNRALAFQPVRLFSDLLLHDMGSLNDNIAQAAAATNQMRTPPLWGVRVRAQLGVLNHDGLSTNFLQAISRHDGEGLNARVRFFQLKAQDQNDLINFLNTL